MSATEQRKLSAIMFTDMVGYSTLSQRNEALALELLEEHRELFERLGPQPLKNISAPMELFRIVLPWERTKDNLPNSTKARPERKITSRLALRWVLVSAVMLLALALGWWLAQRRSHQAGNQDIERSPTVTPSKTAAFADRKSVAVLPFVNMSADKADDYLSDGMTEELFNALARIERLRVPGRSSSFAFKGKSRRHLSQSGRGTARRGRPGRQRP